MYSHSYVVKNRFFCKNFGTLERLEKILFDILINVIYDSHNNKKYEQLAKYYVRRITIWRPTPYFPIHLADVPAEIKKELMYLTDSELDVLMNNLIETIFRYSLRNEAYFNLQYFDEEILNYGLLKWRLT